MLRILLAILTFNYNQYTEINSKDQEAFDLQEIKWVRAALLYFNFTVQ